MTLSVSAAQVTNILWKACCTPQHSVSSIQQEIGSYWNNKNSEAHALWKDTNQLEKHIYILLLLLLLLYIIYITIYNILLTLLLLYIIYIIIYNIYYI